ncbi:hypothetical protein EYF80_016230 [Liparis tanakae]|uniref:Uncharacterized protein n=1 Tax=Liparis tanakae TaxID=230148 RepID=A0A4Z2I896_9TELE|nr:hypothetical protein EYF80_016230 [Liparis tanakae]
MTIWRKRSSSLQRRSAGPTSGWLQRTMAACVSGWIQDRTYRTAGFTTDTHTGPFPLPVVWRGEELTGGLDRLSREQRNLVLEHRGLRPAPRGWKKVLHRTRTGQRDQNRLDLDHQEPTGSY